MSFFNQEVEQAILSSIISNNENIYKFINYLEVDDFYDDKNSKIYKKIIEFFNSGQKIDLLTLSEHAKELGGNSYLAHIASKDFRPSSIKQYVDIIKDKSIRRQLLNCQAENENEIKNEEKDIKKVLAEVQDKIVNVNLIGKKDDTIQSCLKELTGAEEEYSEKYKAGKKYLGIPCGIEKIDEYIDGLREGHIWTVGAFTSTGKTMFALNVLYSVLQNNVPCSVISLEMSKVDLTARLIGIRCNISSMKVIKGFQDEELQTSIDEAKEFLSKSDLEIHTDCFEIERIKMSIRKDVYTRGIKFVIIDYIQNILSDNGLREYELLTQSATDLQALARELGITIYIVSQISNEAEKGVGAGAGFKGTGALEAVSDIAIRLKRNRAEENLDAESVPVDIIITKNRHGFTGIIKDYVMWLKSGKFEKEMKVVSYD